MGNTSNKKKIEGIKRKKKKKEKHTKMVEVNCKKQT